MVPLAAYASESFLSGLRALTPEYRSTGEYSNTLKNFARSLTQLADTMRQEVLARTIYTAQDFTVLLDPGEVIHDVFSRQPIAISPSCSRFPVGALDLRYHDNLFFAEFLTHLQKAEFYGWERTTRKATLDFRWIPPATLTISHDVNGKFDGYRITNPDACAAAANAQSESDYAELISVSGYPQLLQLATLFRHESTDPDTSETVQALPPELDRRPLPGQTVTIESEPVPLTGKITASARREPQKGSASVQISTQPIERVLPIEYKIRLRTLKSIWGANRWREPVYRSFQFLHYEPVLNDRSFLELIIDERGTALAAELLIEGHSPADGPRHAEGTATLEAHTFDWWIPVKPPFSLTVPLDQTEKTLRGLGHRTTMVDTGAPALAADKFKPSDPGARFASTSDVVFEQSFPRLSFLDGTQDWEGEHREPRAATVTINYRLDWDADRLQITLEALPGDRNYVVYVVVEEKLQGGVGHVPHTATPVPMNGQLTYVPQSFFDAERAAIEKAAKAAAEFNRKYSKSATVGPNDPIVGWLRPGDLTTTAGLSKVLTLAEQHQPALLREVLNAPTTSSAPALTDTY